MNPVLGIAFLGLQIRYNSDFQLSCTWKIKNPKSSRELKFSTFELLRFLLGLIGSLAVFGEPAVSATWENENP